MIKQKSTDLQHLSKNLRCQTTPLSQQNFATQLLPLLAKYYKLFYSNNASRSHGVERFAVTLAGLGHSLPVIAVADFGTRVLISNYWVLGSADVWTDLGDVWTDLGTAVEDGWPGTEVESVPGIQVQHDIPPASVAQDQPGVPPDPVVPGISPAMKQFIEGFVAYLQQAKHSRDRECSYLEQLHKYKHPTFSGSTVPSEAEAWFKSIGKTLNAMKCPKDQRVTLATYLLQGKANHWWDTAKRTIVETPALWASFQDRSFEQYFPQSYRHTCISEFYMLEQGDMSVSRYD
ncbi:hypothetical protein GIB67_006794 [Kingdonia uniflora]|uniref:Retrotransposon gag domain-containing protein n=1 Tax=Kingdonia uniflora TaxID=39325 RepID=A0A7J7L016_9MAGN|nr:hypothetical protein GIB67_006794 [Kingdonia uniflora]